MGKRILITGSRDWTDRATIADALRAYAHDGATIVSGACPKGADRICEEEWEGNGPVELHPAEWSRHGRRAGFVRNAEMVKLGADLCMAFIRNGSKGATMTAELAERSGIPTIRFLAE